MIRSLGFLATLLTVGLHGDQLGEVRTAVGKLAASTPITATVDVTRSRHSKGRFLNDDFHGSASATVDSDSAGLHVTFPRSLLDRATDEGTFNVVGEMTGPSFDDCVDFRRPLLRLLDRASVTAVSAESRNGRPATAILLNLPNAADQNGGGIGAVSFTDDHLKIWIGDDHIPMAAERVRKGTAGFMFIRMTTVRTQSWTFTVQADHLVATHLVDSAVVTGPGQDGEARTTWNVREIKAR
jgi:hypothetical protein